jgi:predicted RNase H-like HicB family nuclease
MKKQTTDNVFTYRIVIEPDEDGFHGFVPLLRGVHTWGKTIEETQKNLEEAIRCHLQGLLRDKITPPRQSNTIESIQTVIING